MSANERSIANGRPGRPEAEGIFLTEAHSDVARFFVRFGRGRQIDVWRVDVAALPVEPGPDGWWLCRAPIAPESVELVEVWATDSDDGFGEPSPLPLPPRRKQRR